MNRPDRIIRRSLLLVAVTAAWLGASSRSSGGGRNAALLEPYLQSFPSASGAEIVKLDARLPRSTRLIRIVNGGELLGYGVEQKVTSRSGKFSLRVALSPAGTVTDVQVPDYPHDRGRKVRKPTFLEQFQGFSYGDPMKLGDQVDGVSGATSSATAVTGGVRKALIIVHRHTSSK